MRKYYADELIQELDALKDAVEYLGNSEPNETERAGIADFLALFVEKIRRTYGITSMYYVAAEIKAREKLSEEDEIWP